MQFRHYTFLFFLCCFFLRPGILPAGETQTAPVYLPEQIKKDFKQLYTDLQSAHYNLFANLNKENFDKAFDTFLQKFHKPMTLIQVQLEFQRFVALGDIAHARIDLPMDSFVSYRKAGGTALPLFLYIEDGRAWVKEFYGNENTLEQFQELLAINDKPMSAWLNEFSSLISADNVALSNTLIENQFPLLMWLSEGEKSSFNLRLTTNTAEKDVKVKAITREQLQINANENPQSEVIDWQSQEASMLDHQIAYLRPGPFYNTAIDAADIWDSTTFITFIDNAFKHFIDQQAQALIIDLRSNPGGTNSFSDHMISWFASKPFRFASDFKVKVSQHSKQSNLARLVHSDDESDISFQFKAFYDLLGNGQVFSFELPHASPHKNKRFNAPVFVLIDRYSYSNAVSVAAIVQDYGFGKVIGEKTADLATTYGAMENFTLKNTGISVGYPKALIVRPNGSKLPDGVTPDIQITAPFSATSATQELNQAIILINSELSKLRD
jgi:C-terminal processing protease CtpA/Prc